MGRTWLRTPIQTLVLARLRPCPRSGHVFLHAAYQKHENLQVTAAIRMGEPGPGARARGERKVFGHRSSEAVTSPANLALLLYALLDEYNITYTVSVCARYITIVMSI